MRKVVVGDQLGEDGAFTAAVVPSLVALLKDEDEMVRVRAAEALKAIDPKVLSREY